jgi:AraC-like DNA-binding protein
VAASRIFLRCGCTCTDPTHTREKILPDGAVEIIVDLTDRPKRLYDRDDLSNGRDLRHAWISGMRRAWIVIEAQIGASMVVIRFRPGGAFPFLGFAVEGITDAVDPLDDVLGKVTAALRDRILEAPTTAGKMAAYPHVGAGLPEPEWADLALKHGYYDQAHLIRDFSEFAGLSPGAYLTAYRGLENYLPLD